MDPQAAKIADGVTARVRKRLLNWPVSPRKAPGQIGTDNACLEWRESRNMSGRACQRPLYTDFACVKRAELAE